MEVAGGLCAFMSHSFIKLFHNSSHTSDGISIKVRQFQNLFLLARERATLRLVDWGGAGVGVGCWSCTEDIFPSLYSLSTHLPARSPRRSPSKGNDLAETLLFRGTLWLEPAAGQKWGVVIKVFETKSQKWKALADRLFPGTITLPAVPNIRVQEISAREGVLSSDWWLARKLVKSYVYMTLRGCKLFQA